MSYLVISFSHKNLDIKQREKLAFNSDEDLVSDWLNLEDYEVEFNKNEARFK
jgi:glutamyl-tRNA reductase